MNKILALVMCGLVNFQISAMKQEGAHAASEVAQFRKYQVSIPLSLQEHASTIEKDAFLHIPANLLKAQADLSKDTAIPAEISRTVLGTVLAAHEVQGVQEMEQAMRICTALMFENDKGWEFPRNGVGFQHVNPELYKLIKMNHSYFVFSSQNKMLLLRWDLGEHENGWGFDQVIEIQSIPEHPRQGTCSDILVYYHNSNLKLSGKVLLSTLREEYAKTKQQTLLSAEKMPEIYQKYTEEEINTMHAKDVVAMALSYVSNLSISKE